MTGRIGAAAVCLLVAGLVSSGCGVKRIADEAADSCCPEDLRVDVNDRVMDISWKSNCERLISGYNVYLSEEPLVDKYPGVELPSMVRPFNQAVYSGDTDPEDGVEHFTAELLENGRKYYVSVRIVNPDRTFSRPSNEVVAVCGPRGEIKLSIRYKSAQDGYSFDRNQYVRADNVSNDLYFYSKGGIDYLVSPDRLDGFLRANRLVRLSLSGDFGEVREKARSVESMPAETRVAVKKGDWLHIRTPENTNALVQVTGFGGSGDERKIRLFFAYSPLPGEMIF